MTWAALLFGLLNRARGTGHKALAFTGMGALAYAATLLTGHSIPEGLIAALAMGGWLAAGMASGWGRYFVAYTGWTKPLREREIGWIDATCDFLFGTDYATWHPRRVRAYGAVAFTLRAAYLYPPFLLLSVIDPAYPLIGLGVFSIGAVYWLNQFANWPKYGTLVPEVAYGTVLGILFLTPL